MVLDGETLVSTCKLTKVNGAISNVEVRDKAEGRESPDQVGKDAACSLGAAAMDFSSAVCSKASIFSSNFCSF